MTRACPRCGLELPDHARFCARCGTRQAGPKQETSVWVLVAFGIGIAVSATGAILYAALAIDPAGTPNTKLDPATLRTGAVAFSIALGILCGLQTAALAGLVRGREWGRIVATVACVAWGLTCIGLPVSLLVLNAMWRRRTSEAKLA